MTKLAISMHRTNPDFSNVTFTVIPPKNNVQIQVAIDTLTYKFEVMRVDPADVKEGPDDGIYCHGLWLEGARSVLHL